MFTLRVFKTCSKTFRRALSTKPEITPLYDFHLENGGKMVNFAGYLLPVQYSNLGIAASHLHTRKSASVFDVSHMLQTEIIGQGCVDYFESLCTADLKNLTDNSSVLTVFTDDQGGVLDDLIVTKIRDDHLYVVSNAAMKQQDQKIITRGLEDYKNKNSTADITVKFFEPDERSLIALQGPKSAEILQKHINIDLSHLYFMTSSIATVCEVGACRVTRCGYTGEDGFEISIPSFKVLDVTREILKDSEVELAGLGARDSLRLEAGLCLYGQDLTPQTTPVDAGLTWLIAKRRRQTGDFPGASVILRQIKEGVTTKRVGLVAESGPPARHNTPIVDEAGYEVGVVTSGCPSPTLNKNIAMGYVPKNLSEVGTRLRLNVREKLYNAVVTKMPFVPSKYYVKPK